MNVKTEHRTTMTTAFSLLLLGVGLMHSTTSEKIAGVALASAVFAAYRKFRAESKPLHLKKWEHVTLEYVIKPAIMTGGCITLMTLLMRDPAPNRENFPKLFLCFLTMAATVYLLHSVEKEFKSQYHGGYNGTLGRHLP